MNFAMDIGALSEEDVRALSKRTQTALLELGRCQQRHVRDADPAEIYLNVLGALLAQGKVILIPKAQERDVDHKIGWKDEEYAYFIPDVARREVIQFLRDSGEHFSASKMAIHKALDKMGILVTGKGRLTNQVKIKGRKHNVLQIQLSAVEPEVDEAQYSTSYPEGTRGFLKVSTN